MAKSMTDQSNLFDLTICEGSPNATSSPALEDGATHSGSLAGLTTDPSGRGAALVSPSRLPAPKLADTIPAIFGLSGSSSSRSAALSSSLVNRLKQQLDMDGSIVFAMTWKRKTTPSGRVVSLVRASARSTSGNVSGSWPMPMSGTPSTETYNAAGSTDYERKIDVLMGERESLNGRKASWPTPMVNDELGSDYCYGPKRPDGTRAKFHKLPRAAQLATWATPATRDWKSNEGSEVHHAARREQTRGKPLSEQAHQLSGPLPTGSPAPMGKRGQLNPSMSRWLMGYPAVWCLAAMRAMPSKRQGGRRQTAKKTT